MTKLQKTLDNTRPESVMPGKLQSGRILPYFAVMAERMIRERFRCGAELRAARFGIVLKYENNGDRLLELRKEAYDR